MCLYCLGHNKNIFFFQKPLFNALFSTIERKMGYSNYDLDNICMFVIFIFRNMFVCMCMSVNMNVCKVACMIQKTNNFIMSVNIDKCILKI